VAGGRPLPLHVGDDECGSTEWLTSPVARDLAQHRGLTGHDQLQRWLTEQQLSWLTESGRVLIG